MPGAQLPRKSSRIVDRHVHSAAERVLGLAHLRREGGQVNVPDDQNVDVASRALVPLRGREQIFEDRAVAEVDLGHHLHARRERIAVAVALQVLVLEVDQRAEGERAGRAVAAGETAGARVGVGRLGRVRAEAAV